MFPEYFYQVFNKYLFAIAAFGTSGEYKRNTVYELDKAGQTYCKRCCFGPR